jgi:hypothetical protein
MLLVCALLLAPIAAAQDYELTVELGIGGTAATPGLVAPPFAPLTVQIQRADTRPFKGRVVVELSSQMGGRSRGPFASEPRRVELSQELSLEEGARGATVRFEVPALGMIQGVVTLEASSGGGYDVVDARSISGGVRSDGRALVAFVSQARLANAQPYLFQELVEVQPQHLPETWKLLACFDAVILNDGRPSPRQIEALLDYVAAGGCLILSPNTAAAFNPEQPAARLLGLTGAATRGSVRVGEFKALRAALTPSGLSRGMGMPRMPAPEHGEMPEEGPAPAEELPQAPDDSAELLLWNTGGRARVIEDWKGLLSYARAGAGVVVLVHADLSQYPLVTPGARKPTVAGVNLIAAAIKAGISPSDVTPLARLGGTETRDTLEIAGRRIPGRDVQVILLFVYVGAAGVGMFLLARRLRRPEIYPAALLGLALVSVLLVFSLGEVYKRAGPRAKAARLVVSDGASGRSAVFSMGCAYIVDQTALEFATDRSGWLLPAKPGGAFRGLPADFLPHTARQSAMETVTAVDSLSRWQNLFFAAAGPGAVGDLRVGLAATGGAHTLENRSPHRLDCCLVLIGGPAVTGTGPRCEWHYLASVGAGAGPDAKAPLSKATRAPDEGTKIAERLAADSGDKELAGRVLAALLGVSEHRRVYTPRSLEELERLLEQSGLLPAEGEFLLLALLPSETVSKGSLGLRDLEPGRVDQAVLWAARGLVESR